MRGRARRWQRGKQGDEHGGCMRRSEEAEMMGGAAARDSRCDARCTTGEKPAGTRRYEAPRICTAENGHQVFEGACGLQSGSRLWRNSYRHVEPRFSTTFLAAIFSTTKRAQHAPHWWWAARPRSHATSIQWERRVCGWISVLRSNTLMSSSAHNHEAGSWVTRCSVWSIDESHGRWAV